MFEEEDRNTESKPIVIVSMGKDQGLVALICWFDPMHKAWEACHGKPVVFDNSRYYTLH